MKQAVILCGGLGTRLGSLVKDTPKPMLPVGGKPILAHTIELLKANGITNIILAAGYKADVIDRYFRNDWGADVTISVENEPLGTAGPLQLVKEKLENEFLVLYGDEFVDFDMAAFIKKFEETKPLALILARPSTHPWDSHLIQTENGKVTAFITHHEPGKLYRNLGNAAVYVMRKEILDFIPQGKSDFAKDIFPKALAAGAALMTHTMRSSDYVKDMGTPERFAQVEEYLKNRAEIEHARKNPGPITTVFLDRDGVLNKDSTELIHRPDQLQILPGVPDAIKILNRKNIRTVVVTNQPAIARGLCEVSALNLIHQKLKGVLESDGARLDAIYYCPHHPETHHDDGVKELRKACDCRKPGIGMILQAKKEMNINLGNAVMIGDSSTDIEAGKNAGLRTILVKTGAGRVDADGPKPDYEFDTLLDATKAIALGKVR